MTPTRVALHGGWPRGPQRVPLWCWDVGLALGVAVVGLLPSGHTPRWGYPAAFAGGLALVFRRRWPRLVLLATFPALIGSLGTIAAGAALYAVGRARPSYRALRVPLALSMAVTLAPIVYNDVRYDLGPPAWGDWVVTVLAVLLITAGPGGALAATRMQLTASLATLRATEADRDAAVSAKVRAEERNRLAREVHDIVGHYAALIAVQAGALESRTADPQTRDTAARLRELSSDALEEMRTAVAMWGRAGAGPAAPQDWVPWVLQPAVAARESGVALTLRREPGLPDTVGEPILRVLRRAVQEGVTNAVRHCPGTPVEVRLEPADAAVRIVVRNPFPAPSLPAPDSSAADSPAADSPATNRAPAGPPLADRPAANGGGRGLSGLRHRVTRLGGTVEAGPTDDGCWELTVTCG
jgi:signal transduction histidine kinase